MVTPGFCFNAKLYFKSIMNETITKWGISFYSEIRLTGGNICIDNFFWLQRLLLNFFSLLKSSYFGKLMMVKMYILYLFPWPIQVNKEIQHILNLMVQQGYNELENLEKIIYFCFFFKILFVFSPSHSFPIFLSLYVMVVKYMPNLAKWLCDSWSFPKWCKLSCILLLYLLKMLLFRNPK